MLALGALDFGLEQSIILPALPALAAHYDASLAAVGWLVTGFLLAGIVAVPLLGRLGDLFGKRRMLLVALGAFAVGSLICAATDSIELVIAGRIIQGIGSAVGPLTFALARDTVAPHLLPRAIGAIVGAASAGLAIGFVLSGVLVDEMSVPAIFWFLFLLAAALVVAVFALVPESGVRARVPIDFAGAAVLSVGLATLLLAISKGNDWGWSSPRIIGLFAASLVALTVFVLIERRVREPLVDLGLVVTKPFAGVNICVFVFGYGFYLVGVVLPLIAGLPEAGGGLGYSTTEIGLMLFPTGVASILSAWVAGRLVDRVGPRALVAVGSVLGIAGYASLALAHSTLAELTVPSALLGVAWGLILTAIYPVVLRGASDDKTGVAVAVTALTRNTALALGSQIAFAIIIGAGLVGPFPADSGFTRVFVMGLAGACVLLLVSPIMPGRAAARE